LVETTNKPKSFGMKKYSAENEHGTKKWRWVEDDFPSQTGDFEVPC